MFLTAALAGASGTTAMVASPPEPAGAAPPKDLGVTGQLPREVEPGPDLLRDAAHPEELRTGAGPAIELPRGPLGIPEPMLRAYQHSADRLGELEPGCGIDWSVLASIGRIESGHARGGKIDVNGTTVSAILGPRLDGGPNVAAIRDTDNGEHDGDPVWDRAVGPMQFIPSTWEKYAVDGNDDGIASPHNVHDATTAAGEYLCSGGSDLRDEDNLVAAIFGYNHSDSYVRTVLVWADAYRRGVTPTAAELAPANGRDVLDGERLPDEDIDSAPENIALPPAPVPPGPPPSEPRPAPSTEPGREPSSTPPEPTDSSSPKPTDPSSEPTEPSESPSDDPSEEPTEPPSSEPTEPPSSEPTEPPSSDRPTEPPSEPVACDAALLDNGRFFREDQPGHGPMIMPGTTSPAEAKPGEIVYIGSFRLGGLQQCTVPEDYRPPR